MCRSKHVEPLKKLWNNKFYYKAASCWYLYWVIYDARIHEYQIQNQVVFWFIFGLTISPSSVHYHIHHSVFRVSPSQRLKFWCFIFSDLICSGKRNTLVKKAWINTSAQTAIYPANVTFVLLGHLGIKQYHHARYAAHQTCINISYECEETVGMIHEFLEFLASAQAQFLVLVLLWIFAWSISSLTIVTWQALHTYGNSAYNHGQRGDQLQFSSFFLNV